MRRISSDIDAETQNLPNTTGISIADNDVSTSSTSQLNKKKKVDPPHWQNLLAGLLMLMMGVPGLHTPRL